MNDKKKILVAASIAGILAASAGTAWAGAAFPGMDSGRSCSKQCDINKCKGAGSCKGHHSCKSGAACKGSGACKSSCGTNDSDAAAQAENGTLTGK